MKESRVFASTVLVVVLMAMYLTSYNDSLTGFHEPLSPPYRCCTSLKKSVVQIQSLIVSHGVPDHAVCMKSIAHGHLHDTATAHLSAAVTVYIIVS